MREPGRVLFLTHVGDPGGAELKMIDLCQATRDRAEVMLFQHGSLEEILRRQAIKVSVCAMPSCRPQRAQGRRLAKHRARRARRVVDDPPCGAQGTTVRCRRVLFAEVVHARFAGEAVHEAPDSVVHE